MDEFTRRRVRVFPEWRVGLSEYTGVDYRRDELDDCQERWITRSFTRCEAE
jgi:hypothetical protein